MGEPVLRKLEELQQLPPQVHWFCPRSAGDDYGHYFDEDVGVNTTQETAEENTDRRKKVREAESRRDAALDACKIFAFDGTDAKPYQDQLRSSLVAQLNHCDICVREYHRARTLLVQTLEAQFDSDEVEAFMKTFDSLNIDRIAQGLDKAKGLLQDVPPEERGINTIGDEGLYALFEALNCVPFLRDEEAMANHLDQPFRLVQTKKKLRLPNYAPGMISFLYSHNNDRAAWALRNIGQIKRPLTENEFEYSVRPFLETALGRVHILSLEQTFLPAFWRGTKMIINKIDKEIVTNKLRPMEANLYTVALEHFQIDGTHFEDLLSSYQRLIQLSPHDFWDALGPITAQAVAETIFRSPTLQKQLKTREEREPLHLEEKMEWPIILINSISPANIVPPVRSILEQLLRNFQKDPYSRYAQSVTWTKGLTCMLTALRKVSERVKSGPLVANMIEVVAHDHIDSIMMELSGTEQKVTEMQIGPNEQICLDIVEQTLKMDVNSLSHDRNTIQKMTVTDHDLQISGMTMWKRSMSLIRPGHPLIAASILSGVRGILVLEKFSSRQVEKALKPAKGWNDALKRAHEYIIENLLGRLDSFRYDDMFETVQDPRALDGLIRLLFNGENQIHHGAVSVIKILSEADDRRECLRYMLSIWNDIAMAAVTNVLEDLTRARCFAPCTTAVKVCTEIFSGLCASGDGLLRAAKKKPSHKHLETYWAGCWQLLAMIFQQTESWSNLGYDKGLMQDFCRETMDLAEHGFNQYSVFAGAIQSATGKGDSAVRERLLEQANRTFGSIIKWLRLRDDYLIAKAVELTAKMLRRLAEVGMKVDDSAAQFVEDVVMSSEKNAKVKTKLSMQQKAELQRALEQHMGDKFAGVIDLEAPGRLMKQQNLEGWASSGRSSGASTPTSDAPRGAKPGTINMEAWSDASKRRKETEAWEEKEMKKLMGSMSARDTAKLKQQQMLEKQRKAGLNSIAAKAVQKTQQQQNDFLAKRQKEKEEAERRKRAQLAKDGGVGVGSGVAGLGDMGKDHSMKGQNVMVSSDEESEDDDDELDADLFGLGEKKKITRPNVDPNGAVGLKAEQKAGPTRIQRTARSAKDMRARLAPDLTSLHQTILSWDFFHIGDYPPGANEHQFRRVSDSFTDPTTYQQTFQPLLTLEAWQAIVRAREESTSKPFEFKVQTRTNVDSFIEISSIVSHNDNRELQLSESDVVLLSKSKNCLQDPDVPHCLARIYRVKRQKMHCEVVYQLLPSSSLAPSLAGQAMVWGLKVQTLTPLEREYGALQALQYYDLCTQIIKARPSKRTNFSEKQLATYQEIWNVNRAQSEAVNAALENEGFSLIQGPPGSGKTKTIVAIVGGLLTHALSASNGGTKITLPKAAGNQSGGMDAPSKKLLVCAPSNAAVDELVMRLKDGVKTKSGRDHKLNVVRIGRSDAINTQVLDVTMDELVAKRIGGNETDHKKRERNQELYKEHGEVSSVLRELYEKRDSGQLKGKELSDLEVEISSTRKRKNELGIRIDNSKDEERNAGREAELNRKRAQQSILDEAHVICATLSGSGHDMFQSLNIEFETVIIDEAAQCVEMSSLIPLKYGCVKCIMVGDPKQLPPTVFSKEAAKYQYEQSLFVRMQNNFADEVHLLDTQYRMHPEISVFPSKTFYDGLLKDGRNMLGLRQRPWHASSLLAPYRFFDVAGQHQQATRGHSLVNTAEIEIAIALYSRLVKDFPGYDYAGRIGVITPYKSQLRMLKERFTARFGNEIFETIEFNTTDAFQGRESEIIIFSCVRASPTGGIGFLQDIRRMNVGLTRAKSSLWVLGNSDSLIRGQFWKKLVEDARERDSYTTGNLKEMLGRPSSAFPAQLTSVRSMPDADAHVPQMQRPKTTTPSDAAPPPDDPAEDDRMEGVRYRFEDRVSKTTNRSDAGSDRSTSQAAGSKFSETPAEPLDVEMSNADETSSRAHTPGSTGSRAETRFPGGDGHLHPANGHTQPKPGTMAPSVLPQVRKRPAASPFMPRKHPKNK